MPLCFFLRGSLLKIFILTYINIRQTFIVHHTLLDASYSLTSFAVSVFTSTVSTGLRSIVDPEAEITQEESTKYNLYIKWNSRPKTLHAYTTCNSNRTGGNVTSVGWQIILYDPIWHVSSDSGVVLVAQTAIRFLTLPYTANWYIPSFIQIQISE